LYLLPVEHFVGQQPEDNEIQSQHLIDTVLAFATNLQMSAHKSLLSSFG
jgi:hypothetical protein